MLGLVSYWGLLYMDERAAGFDARVYEPFRSFSELDARQPKDEAQLFLARGKVAYEQACMPCHQQTGLGVPGQFPPLAESEWANTTGAGRMIRIALHGLSGEVVVKGQKWNAAMPGGIGETLSDNDLAAAISYIRGSWGNKASLVKPAEVKAVKSKTAGRSQPWTAGQLLDLPDVE
jgi:mono/diheme cytochrome c family protein